jgi:hypothetical protein
VVEDANTNVDNVDSIVQFIEEFDTVIAGVDRTDVDNGLFVVDVRFNIEFETELNNSTDDVIEIEAELVDSHVEFEYIKEEGDSD